LARKGSNAIYSIIRKSRKWLIINYGVNVTRGVIPSFYIFRGERLKDDYIKLCKLDLYGNAKNTDDYFRVNFFFAFL